ncbi:K(+) efflux antiporter 2, chloroplastic [Magnolia sinica]|uniref:K(+) efflux antiporter 2, chloroplastic n=1 Tax=Magnolia sinica TaxID=86752 RepID=UPI00265A1978|nr:K(+) efflux antiporter 2, chloroplastic [Magnolia sinica]
MDFACTFPSSRASISLSSDSSRHQHRWYCRNFLNDSRVFYRPSFSSSSKKKKGMMLPVAGCVTLNGNLGNFFKSSRAFVSVKCQRSESVDFVDGDGRNFEFLRSPLEEIVGPSYLVGPTSGLLCKKAKSRTVAGNFGNFSNPLRAFTRVRCQSNESLAYVNGSNGRNFEFTESLSEGTEDPPSMLEAGPTPAEDTGAVEEVGPADGDALGLEDLRELLQKAVKELEVAQLNSTMFEEKAQSISESAIALKDEAANAWNDVTSAVSTIQIIIGEEVAVKEAVQKATMALSMAEARLQLAVKALDSAKEFTVIAETPIQGDPNGEIASGPSCLLQDEEEAILAAQDEIRECTMTLANCEAELKRLLVRKTELQKEVDRLSEVAEEAQMNALKAEEDVANIMLLAEQAVAFELEATQRLNDAEIALQRAEKLLTVVEMPDASASVDVLSTQKQLSSGESGDEQEKVGDGVVADVNELAGDGEILLDVVEPGVEESKLSDEVHHDQENRKLSGESLKEVEVEAENTKLPAFQMKKQETQKDLTKDGSSLGAPKALLKKSSRFFSASFFSFDVDGTESTPASVFHGLLATVKKQMPKLVLGALLLGAGAAFFSNRLERSTPLLQQPDVITTGIEEVTSTAKPLVREIRRFPKRVKKLIEMLPHQEISEEEASLFDMLWLLLASVIFVPIFQKIPGGSPVLGYLAAGILIGPYGLSIIRHVHGTKAIAEFGVVFLLFNIGLELSVERLSSMKKYVFGLGSAQVLATAVVIGLVAHYVAGLPGPAAIVIGNGLALSSTAVVLQVLQERGESTSRHGRATFSVLLFQDLAVVVLLILIPLISPNSSKGGLGFQAIAEALGLAAVKAIVAITAIIAGGRLLLRPIYKQIAENQNAEIFSANTLLVILGTSLLTARAGLSMALGAFLAGLLLAETEFSLQVESDIAPYRGLLLGLFFMTVGMSIDPKLLLSNFPVILGALSLLIGGKTILVALVGKLFGISPIAAIRVGLLLAPGGEFAFVAFGEAVNQAIMSPQLSSLLFLVVGISMALTPWLAAGGQLIASRFEQHDVRSLLPVESETDDLQDHIIICGFGRVGQIIAQLLSERLIPFVALDVRSDRVAVGRALDLPVYFGDAGSREVLHKIGAERACAAAITLDTPGANYRTVWALSKYFPNVKTFVRAHDVDHGLNLEKAGATAVVPETLEPSLQLAAAVLAQAKLPTSEIAATINEFRNRHLSELTELCEATGSSLGYGFSRVMTKPKPQASSSDSDENQVVEGTLAI